MQNKLICLDCTDRSLVMYLMDFRKTTPAYSQYKKNALIVRLPVGHLIIHKT